MQKTETEDRQRFDLFLKNMCGMGLIDGQRVPAGQLPSKSLFEYRFDVQETCWVAWQQYVGPYEPPKNNKFSEILVPTVDVVR